MLEILYPGQVMSGRNIKGLVVSIYLIFVRLTACNEVKGDVIRPGVTCWARLNVWSGQVSVSKSYHVMQMRSKITDFSVIRDLLKQVFPVADL